MLQPRLLCYLVSVSYMKHKICDPTTLRRISSRNAAAVCCNSAAQTVLKSIKGPVVGLEGMMVRCIVAMTLAITGEIRMSLMQQHQLHYVI
jgi:hypothetical protein